MRIVSDSGKVAAIVLGVVVVPAAALMVGLASGALVGYLVSVLLTVAFMTVVVRCFRGDGEPVQPPRAWWRATHRPAAGFVVGAVFFLQACTFALGLEPGGRPAPALVSAGVDLIIAAYFIHSSVRLSRHPAPGDPAPLATSAS